MKNQNKVNVKVTESLRTDLMNKKYKLKFDGIGTLIQAMYNLITKHKMWEELKEKGK
ncbi:hypothetical protein LCGC14_1194220 [marine sediment metagenome]|uniref:Uncharacterized protein n=1 Tax=marine sediment metagenome TaxID=412755 RepID=A0A0F9LIT3_9ZZZZ